MRLTQCLCSPVPTPGKVDEVVDYGQQYWYLRYGDGRFRNALHECGTRLTHGLALRHAQQSLHSAGPPRLYSRAPRPIIPSLVSKENDREPTYHVQKRVYQEAPAPTGLPGDESFDHRGEVRRNNYPTGPDVDHASDEVDVVSNDGVKILRYTHGRWWKKNISLIHIRPHWSC